MSIAPILFSTTRSIVTATPKFVFSTLTGRLSTIAANYFGLGQGVFFFGYGAKELVFDGIIQQYKMRPLGENPTMYARTIHKIRVFLVKVFQAHGTLYVLSAIAWIGAELDKLNHINLGFFLPAVRSASNILFLGACVLAIGYQAVLLKEAIDISKIGNQVQKQTAKCMKISATLGIVGNIGYILAVGLLMLEGPPLVVAILAGVAVIIGCVKVLYDYKCLTPALERV